MAAVLPAKHYVCNERFITVILKYTAHTFFFRITVTKKLLLMLIVDLLLFTINFLLLNLKLGKNEDVASTGHHPVSSINKVQIFNPQLFFNFPKMHSSLHQYPFMKKIVISFSVFPFQGSPQWIIVFLT